MSLAQVRAYPIRISSRFVRKQLTEEWDERPDELPPKSSDLKIFQDY